LTELQPGTRIGGCELVRRLGVGGMGEVWLANEANPRRAVALKFVKPELLRDAGFRTRFRNEAETLAGLEHDRIVPLYRLLEEEGHLALVLRYIPGSTLADRIDAATGPLSMDVVLAVARDVLRALGFAHRRGTIHRDIKPQNVLVDPEGQSFLTDFGIALGDAVERSTLAGFAIGTPHYMSPEQIRTPQLVAADGLGVQSDIYSVGVVLYEMLTGTVPFGADLGSEHAFAVQRAHVEDPPRPLREINPEVPPAVERIVLACLAKQATQRPSSCEALMAELEAAAGAGRSRGAGRVAAATVIERAGPAAEPRPESAPPATRRPSRSWGKARAVAAGLIVATGLVTWTALSNGRRDGPGRSAQSGAAETSAKSDAKPSTGTGAAGQADPRPDPKGRDMPKQPVAEGVSPVTVPPSTTAPPPPSVGVKRLIDEAHSLAKQEDWCPAVDRLNTARQRGAQLQDEDLDLYETARQMCSAGPH